MRDLKEFNDRNNTPNIYSHNVNFKTGYPFFITMDEAILGVRFALYGFFPYSTSGRTLPGAPGDWCAIHSFNKRQQGD